MKLSTFSLLVVAMFAVACGKNSHQIDSALISAEDAVSMVTVTNPDTRETKVAFIEGQITSQEEAELALEDAELLNLADVMASNDQGITFSDSNSGMTESGRRQRRRRARRQARRLNRRFGGGFGGRAFGIPRGFRSRYFAAPQYVSYVPAATFTQIPLATNSCTTGIPFSNSVYATSNSFGCVQPTVQTTTTTTTSYDLGWHMTSNFVFSGGTSVYSGNDCRVFGLGVL